MQWVITINQGRLYHGSLAFNNHFTESSLNLSEFTTDLKAHASTLGFVLSGVTAAAEPARYAYLQKWLDAGYAGQMHYLEARREAYRSPSSVLDGCTTLLMLGYPYRTEEPPAVSPGSGRVARYAWGEPDYHDHLFAQLKELQRWVLARHPAARVRGVVDTAPLLEREFAEAAGLGWVGKNTLLLNRQWGSYFFLAALLTDLPLTIDPPLAKAIAELVALAWTHVLLGHFQRPTFSMRGAVSAI